MDENRPILDIPLSKAEHLALSLMIVGVVATLLVCVKYLPMLPDKIPTHFGASGQPDGWGGKGTFFLIPVVGTISALFLYMLSRFPQIYNYPVALTEQNIRAQYQNSRSAMLWLGAEIACLIAYSEFGIAQVGLGKAQGFGAGFLPIFLLILVGSGSIHIYKAYKAR